MSADTDEIARKLDVVATKLDFFFSATQENARRIKQLEDDLRPITKFVNDCGLGRRVLLYLVGGTGTVFAVGIALYDRVFK